MTTPAVPLQIPLGHLLGRFAGTSGLGSHRVTVRLGATLHDLDDDETAIWLLAHSLPDRPADPWTEATIAATAVELGLAAAPPVLARLRERGLVVELRTDTPDAVAFARAYRIMPAMLGLGNAPEAPADFRIGLLGRPVLHLPDVLYDVWCWSPVDVHLWNACRGAADLARQTGRTDPDETDPELLLDVFLLALHPLLATGAAYLDERRATAPHEPRGSAGA